MNLGYKQYFPLNGEPTYFKEKIKMGIDKVAIQCLCPDINLSSYVLFDTPKIHTIREDTHDRWKPGMKIHHSYGVRTKSYRCFAINECQSIQRIEITEVKTGSSDNSYCFPIMSPKQRKNAVSGKIFRVTVDDKVLSNTMIDQIAKNDGFNTTEDFFLWFNGNFKGKIIHWTNLKY